MKMRLVLIVVLLMFADVAFADNSDKQLLYLMGLPPGAPTLNGFTGEGPVANPVGTQGATTIIVGKGLKNAQLNVVAIKMQCFMDPSPSVYPSASAGSIPFLYYINGNSSAYMVVDSGEYVYPISSTVQTITFKPLSSAGAKFCPYEFHQNPNQ